MSDRPEGKFPTDPAVIRRSLMHGRTEPATPEPRGDAPRVSDRRLREYIVDNEPHLVRSLPDHEVPTGVLAALDLRDCRRDLAAARDKADAYDATHSGDWLERAHAVSQAASANDVSLYGRDVWHICVEQAERLAAVTAERDRLAAALVAIERIADTLSPQEVVNICTDARGVARREYMGECHPFRSVVELRRELQLAAANMRNAAGQTTDPMAREALLADAAKTDRYIWREYDDARSTTKGDATT